MRLKLTNPTINSCIKTSTIYTLDSQCSTFVVILNLYIFFCNSNPLSLNNFYSKSDWHSLILINENIFWECFFGSLKIQYVESLSFFQGLLI